MKKTQDVTHIIIIEELIIHFQVHLGLSELDKTKNLIKSFSEKWVSLIENIQTTSAWILG